MAQWAAFTIVVALLALLLLGLARQSQELLETAASEESLAETDQQRSDDAATDAGTSESSLSHSSTDESESKPHSPASSTASSHPDAGPGHGGDSIGTSEPTHREDSDRSATASTAGSDQQIATPSDAIEHADSSGGAEGQAATRSPSEMTLTPTALLANVAFTQGLVIVLVLVAGWYFSIPADAFGVTGEAMSTGLPAIGLGLIFGGLLWIGNEFSTTIADAVGAAYDETVREMLAPESPGGWALLFGGVLPIIAIAEELLFRAALIGVPAAGFDVSPWALAIVSSLAFAFGHGAQGTVGVIVTGVLGFVLAAAYILSGSLLLVIVAHYVINALEFFIHEYAGIDDVFGGIVVVDG